MDYIHELDNFIIESDICMLENAMQIQSLNEAERSDKFRKIFSAMKERVSKLFESFIEFVQKKLKGIKEKIEDYMHDKEIYNEEDLNGVVSLNISDYLKEKKFNNTGKFIMRYLNELNNTLEKITGQEGSFENTRKRLVSIISKLSSEPAASDSDSIKAKEIKYQYFTRLLNSSITTLKLYKLCINIVDTAVTNIRKQFNERAPFETFEPETFKFETFEPETFKFETFEP